MNKNITYLKYIISNLRLKKATIVQENKRYGDLFSEDFAESVSQIDRLLKDITQLLGYYEMESSNPQRSIHKPEDVFDVDDESYKKQDDDDDEDECVNER